jgi:hypothetical protein
VTNYSRQVKGKKLRPETSRTDQVLRWKLELSRVYWSQLTWARIKGLEDYARRVGLGVAMERTWVVVQ